MCIKKLSAKLVVEQAFERAGVPFENPKKQGIISACKELAISARQFRSSKIITKHYNEIMKLVDLIPDDS